MSFSSFSLCKSVAFFTFIIIFSSFLESELAIVAKSSYLNDLISYFQTTKQQDNNTMQLIIMTIGHSDLLSGKGLNSSSSS